MQTDLISLIERKAPLGGIGRKRPIVVSPLDMHPVIRIAHRRRGPLNISDRILMDHELVLILKGRGTITIGRRSHSFRPHELFFIPPFSLNRFSSASEEVCEHIAMHFDFAPNLPPIGKTLSQRRPYEIRFTEGRQLPQQVSLIAGDPIEQMFADILRARSGGGVIGQTEAGVHLMQILILLLKRQDRAPMSSRASARIAAQMQRAAAFAESNFTQKLSAPDLAAAAGLSASHFNRLFREWSGHSPAEFLRRLRIEKARELLGNIDLSIKQVAVQTGFDDAYHFSKVFRRIDGLPPTRYRENLFAGRG